MAHITPSTLASSVNVYGIDIRNVRSWVSSGLLRPNSIVTMFVPYEYSTDIILPNVGDVFLGVVNRPNMGVDVDTIHFYRGKTRLGGNLLVGSFIRPSQEPLSHRLPHMGQKIHVSATRPNNFIELAFYVNPDTTPSAAPPQS